jgi:glucokinase
MYISLDIGGTSTRIALSNNLSDVVKNIKIDTVHDILKFKTLIASHLHEMCGATKPDAICSGVAGYLNKPRTKVLKAANFHNLETIELQDLFSDDYKYVPKFFENDACLAGLGEATLGSGKDFRSVAYLSLGTGVGGVLIEDKKLNPLNKIYEPGHQIVDFKSTVHDGLGIKGTLETLISGSGFYKQFKKNPLTCTDKAVWEQFGYTIGIGLLNISMMWNPDVVVIGGGVSDRYDLFYPGIQSCFSEIQGYPLPKVKRASFGEGSGIVGGFVLTRQKLAI